MSLNKLSSLGIKRLEITMRDVMDGLEDAAGYMNYQSVPNVVEILSIEPPGRPIQKTSQVIQLTKASSSEAEQESDIVDYLIQKEQLQSA